ncbi:MAG: DUF6361 family protein [Streptosporangiaceae bacterium]
MTAILAWLDYSERDRKRALDVVGLLREPSTVDELGLGAIRDALADLLFPGTSTIQTRARYFLFVPWQYAEIERLRVPAHQAPARDRRAEIELIDALADAGQRQGVIGIQARRTLKRLPSSVYWSGLLAWGIRRFPGSPTQYYQSLDGFNAGRRAVLDDDRNLVDGVPPRNWDPGLPAAPRGFPMGATFDLTASEARYLRERIIVSHRDSLLAFLVGDGEPTGVAFAWEHPQHSRFREPFSEQLAHARLFSEGMHGAQLLYNLLLAEATGNDEWTGSFAAAMAGWADLMSRRAEAFDGWDRRRFWAVAAEGGARVSRRTRDFTDSWLGLVISADPAGLAGLEAARQLIRDRERELKGQRARLQNRQALLLWRGDAGSRQMDFRWAVAQTIVNDILGGLRSDA